MRYNVEWWFSYFNSFLLVFLNTLILRNWFIHSIRVSNDSIISSNEFQNLHSNYSHFHTNLWIWTRMDEWYECTYISSIFIFILLIIMIKLLFWLAIIKSDIVLSMNTLEWCVNFDRYRNRSIHVLFPHYTLIRWIKISSEY